MEGASNPAFTVRISANGYYGCERHETMKQAYWRAVHLVKRATVVVRRRPDGKRFSVGELKKYDWGTGP